MSVADRFSAMLSAQPAQFDGPELLPVRLARATVQMLPEVDGAGISVLADPALRVPLGASDPDAATAERLQFTLGVGPCLLAHATGESVVADDGMFAARWPQLYDELTAHTPYRAVIAVPLRHQFRGLGALDLHLSGTPDLSTRTWDAAYTIADEIVAALVARTGRRDRRFATTGDPPWLDSPSAHRRQQVWMAVGMISVHLDTDTTDALAVLRAHAFVRGVDLDDLAEDLTSRRIPIDDIRR